MTDNNTTDIGGVSVTVKELTVADIRDRLRAISNEPENPEDEDILDAMLLKKITFSDLFAMTDLDQEGLDKLSGLQLEKLVAECERLNPLFFKMLDRLAMIGRTIQSD
ncbi:MAG: hypothetical protein M3H12_13815 [Chromatiales bacterium]|nr:hypothetical protein [Gammaproteobacteria bacterium]